jgi:magnesium transporter
MFSQTIAKRIRLLSARTGLSTDWITYGILDDVIDMLSPVIYESECEVERIDDLCMQPGVAKDSNFDCDCGNGPYATNAGMFHRITACRKTLTCLTRLVAAKNEAVRNVLKRCASRLSEDALVYLRDLQDHILMMEQSLEHQDDALNRAYSNYLAHISIETSVTSNKMSRVMKTLSAFAAVTTPCTVVSCLLGMNLRGPFWPYGLDKDGPGSGSGGPYDFFIVVSFILSATILLVYVGKRNDWF